MNETIKLLMELNGEITALLAAIAKQGDPNGNFLGFDENDEPAIQAVRDIVADITIEANL